MSFGLSAAQTMFTGEGYSTSQLAFFNSPLSSAFEPSVEKYWGTYIAGAGKRERFKPDVRYEHLDEYISYEVQFPN